MVILTVDTSMPRIAINGFGRIGRQALKAGWGKAGFTCVAINDVTDIETLAHLLKHDTSYRSYAHDVRVATHALVIDGTSVRVFTETDPARLPWKELDVDVVLECTGRFTRKEEAEAHIRAGAKRVILSAPAKGEGVPTHIMGINQDTIDPESTVINNASCTTNCIAPLIAILDEEIGVSKAMMTTVHGYTADQNVQDGPHKDLRRARAAAENIVPTTTGAARATTEVIPHLKQRFDGLAVRVPVPIVSLSDVTAVVRRPTTIEEVQRVFRAAARSKRWQGLVEVTDEPLVSSDFIGSSASAIVDLSLVNVVDGDLVKVVAWYDNEWGYANRLVELALYECRS